MSVVSVYVLFTDRDEAERIARAMVERALAACVNILGECQSIYRWEGRVESASEVAAIFKTSQAGLAALVAAIQREHRHAVPGIVAWPTITLQTPYGEWVEQSVR